MNVLSNQELRSILDQMDSIVLILEIYCSIENPDEDTVDQIETLQNILDSYNNIIESVCSIEKHSKLIKY